MNNKSRYYIRVLAGAYLMYQGYNLMKAAMAEHIAIIFPIFGILFFALGLAIGGSALVTLHKMNKEEQENGGAAEMPEISEDPEVTEASEIAKGQENLSGMAETAESAEQEEREE